MESITTNVSLGVTEAEDDQNPNMLEFVLPSTSVALAEISEAEDVQDSKRTVKSSSLPTPLSVGSDINKAEEEPDSELSSPRSTSSEELGSDINNAEDEPGSELSSPGSTSSEERQVNPIIEELNQDYLDNGRGDLNLLEELQKESPRLQKELGKGLKKTGKFLKKGDIKGAMQQVEEVLNQFHAIQYLRAELLPKHQSTNVMSDTEDKKPPANDTMRKRQVKYKHGEIQAADEVTDTFNLYNRLFKNVLFENYLENHPSELNSPYVFEFENIPWSHYKQTEFMVFLVKKVQKEKLIMDYLGQFPKDVVTNCIRKCEEESFAACISYVRKGKLKEATKMLKETQKSLKRDGEHIIQRGRLYNRVLQEAIGHYDHVESFSEPTDHVHDVGDKPQILPEDPEHKVNWSKRCLQDLTKVQDYFVNLFLKDKHFMDELTFDFMERNGYAYVLLCVWESHMREKKEVQRCIEAGVDIVENLLLLSRTKRSIKWKGRCDQSQDKAVLYAFHGAVLMNRVDIINLFLQDSWPDLDILNAKSSEGETALHVAVGKGCEPMLKYLLMNEKLDINARTTKKQEKKRGLPHRTALHIATEHGYANLVELLCRDEKNNPHVKSIRCHEEDADNTTALDIVYEKLRTEVWEECCHQHKEQRCATCHASYEDIEKILLSIEAVQKGVDRLYRNRQVLVDAANTLLVGAALIASVTFAGWLQPPLGYAQYYEFPTPSPAPPGTYDSYIGVGGNVGIQAFAVFNSLSFFFAIATVIVGADAAFPMHRYKYIGHVVKTMQLLLRRAIKFLMISVVCVLGAFGSAAVVILPPHVYFRKHLVLTVFIGGSLCSVVLWQLLTRHSRSVRGLNAGVRNVIYKYTNIFSSPLALTQGIDNPS